MDDAMFYEVYGMKNGISKEENEYIKVNRYIDYSERRLYGDIHNANGKTGWDDGYVEKPY